MDPICHGAMFDWQVSDLHYTKINLTAHKLLCMCHKYKCEVQGDNKRVKKAITWLEAKIGLNCYFLPIK